MEIPAPVNISTTRNAQGGNTTSTPGSAGTGGSGGLGDLFADILRRKMAGRAQGGGGQQRVGGRAPAAAPTPAYTPSIRSSPARAMPPERVKRFRNVQAYADPGSMRNPGMFAKEEYQLPDGSWSLDGMYGEIGGRNLQGGGGGGVAPGGYSARPSDFSGKGLPKTGWSDQQLKDYSAAPRK